jgi:hypothetical protein
MATLAEQKAKARKAEADALLAEANAGKIGAQTIREKVGAMVDATNAAQAITFLPAIAPVADSLLEEAGFTGVTVPGTEADPAAAPFYPSTMKPNAMGTGGAAGMAAAGLPPPEVAQPPANGMMPPEAVA